MQPGNPDTPESSRRSTLQGALIATGMQDRQAFKLLYQLTAAKLFGICLRICGERQAAEDVLQEVYVIIWRRASSFDAARASPITWMATIARNRAIDWKRANGRFAPAVSGDGSARAHDAADDAVPADQAMIRQQEVQQLHDCLMILEDKPRRAIRAAFLGGLTYSDLARREGVPLATMKSTVRRGLLQLRKCLNNES
ncbi:RNA polymerase sigma factor [Croceibacterium mercuriale]|uniref:RNA polymerase sigma factor n=1 Tax=Croceibacterium mercuriale TaxID=1572751 RepID=A0A0B2BU84_9SPHN|nr:RNA polymerase sigma factor [Croceibacterium mercuriale]